VHCDRLHCHRVRAQSLLKDIHFRPVCRPIWLLLPPAREGMSCVLLSPLLWLLLTNQYTRARCAGLADFCVAFIFVSSQPAVSLSLFLCPIPFHVLSNPRSALLESLYETRASNTRWISIPVQREIRRPNLTFFSFVLLFQKTNNHYCFLLLVSNHKWTRSLVTLGYFVSTFSLPVLTMALQPSFYIHLHFTRLDFSCEKFN